MTRFLVALYIVLLHGGHALEAQTTAVEAGDVVRIDSTAGSGEYTVVALREGMLVLASGGATTAVGVPLSSVHRLEVQREEGPSGRTTVGLGLLVGSLAGAAIANALWEPAPPRPCDGGGNSFLFTCYSSSSSASDVTAGAFLGAVAGAAIGGAVWAITRTEVWEAVPLPLEVGVADPLRGSVFLHGALSF